MVSPLLLESTQRFVYNEKILIFSETNRNLVPLLDNKNYFLRWSSTFFFFFQNRFVDALIPTVASLHPMTVINHLHASCVSQVESANTLKTTKNVALLTQPSGEGEDIRTDYHEETLKTQLQAAIVLPKVSFSSSTKNVRI